MVGDPRKPAIAPTTQAAPNCGRSMPAIIPPLSDGGNLAL